MVRSTVIAGVVAAASMFAVAGPAGGETGASEREVLLSAVRQLTFEGRRSGEGYFSADRRHMIFQSEREPGNPFYQMYLLDLESGDVERVSPGFGKTTCGWIHPRARRVLFSSTHEDPEARAKQQAELDFRASGQKRRYSWDFDEFFEIFELDQRTGTLYNLTRARGYDAEGSYSPDGSLIAFASNRHAYGEPLGEAAAARFAHDKSSLMDIYIMDADGGNPRRLTDAPGYDGGPFFSADGSHIVWRHFAEDGATAEIHTMNIDGTGKRQITRLGAMSWAPFFHPSGEYVIFASNLEGFANFELYLVDAEGRDEPRRVTFTQGFDGLPAFSADGEKLTWTSTRTSDGASQIFVADWNHAHAQRLLGIDIAGRTSGAKTRPAISALDLRLHVARLAAPAMEGRLTGSRGARLAGEYVAENFRRMGLQPAGDDGSFFQDFTFEAGASLGAGNRLTVSAGGALALDRDWRPLAFSRTGTVAAAPVAFAGYGLETPAGERGGGYDSYGDLDVAGKWVLVLRYLPEGIGRARAARLLPYADLQYKAAVARRLGAVGLLVAPGPNAGVAEQLVRFTFDAAGAAASTAAVTITDGVPESLLDGAGRDLEKLQDALDRGEKVPGFVIPGVTVGAHIAIAREKRTGRNVLARLRSGPGGGAPVLALGAHLDHLGRGEASGSLARGEERGKIHFGADDNASGVAALLEIAQYLSGLEADRALGAERDILFAAWSGEELGSLGSTHFAESLARTHGDGSSLQGLVAAYLNMDMIGRLDKSLLIQGVGSSPLWPREIERRNVPVGLPVVADANPYLPTDTTPFYLRGVPVLNAFSGAHMDYSTPRDTVDHINFQGATSVARLMAGIALSLARSATPPEYVQRERPKGSMGRKHLRVYLGTLPDYGASGVEGLRISGTAKGGPAEQAGLMGGDVIRRLAGTEVGNIHDFMGAMALLKPGETVEVTVLRDDRELTLGITAAARE